MKTNTAIELLKTVIESTNNKFDLCELEKQIIELRTLVANRLYELKQKEYRSLMYGGK